MVSCKTLHPHKVTHSCSSCAPKLCSASAPYQLLAHQGKGECGGSRGAIHSGLLQCVMWDDESSLKVNRIACKFSFKSCLGDGEMSGWEQHGRFPLSSHHFGLWIELQIEKGLWYLSKSRNRGWTTTDLYTVLQIYLYVHNAFKGRL